MDGNERRLRVALAVALLVFGVGGFVSLGAETLPRAAVNISWREGPEYPLGIQDSVVGFVSGRLVSTGGFSRHPKNIVERFPDAFAGKPSGFTGIGFTLDPAGEADGWSRISDMPGPSRQGAAMVVVGDALYAFGGFNYDAPHTYRDACRLSYRSGRWNWEALKPLPFAVCEATAVAIGGTIYLVGGADFFAASDEGPMPLVGNEANFYTDADREQRPIGSALWSLDTTSPAADWKRLPDRPGVGQAISACAAVGEKIYVLGGFFCPRAKMAHYHNAVDSWVFDVASEKWSRLPDMPHGSNRRAVAWKDRYILLVAGFKYGQTRLTDGSTLDVY